MKMVNAKPMTIAELVEQETCDCCGADLLVVSAGWTVQSNECWCDACVASHQFCPHCEINVHAVVWDAIEGCCRDCEAKRKAPLENLP